MAARRSEADTLSIDEAAAVCGLPAGELRRAVKVGRLATLNGAEPERIARSELWAWVEAHRIAAPVVRPGETPTKRLLARMSAEVAPAGVEPHRIPASGKGRRPDGRQSR